MLNVILLVNDLYECSEADIIKTKQRIKEHMRGKEATLDQLLQRIGYNDYKLVFITVHFMIVNKELYGLSPYDVDAPDLDKHYVRL